MRTFTEIHGYSLGMATVLLLLATARSSSPSQVIHSHSCNEPPQTKRRKEKVDHVEHDFIHFEVGDDHWRGRWSCGCNDCDEEQSNQCSQDRTNQSQPVEPCAGISSASQRMEIDVVQPHSLTFRLLGLGVWLFLLPKSHTLRMVKHE